MKMYFVTRCRAAVNALHSSCLHSTATGKTRCVDTFTGYKCYCGDGFYAHTNDKGEEECLDVNECWSAGTSLGTNCTCERCACKNIWGGYECIENILDKCTADQGYGSCWHKEYRVNGQNRMFTNCKDNIRAFKVHTWYTRDAFCIARVLHVTIVCTFLFLTDCCGSWR